MELVYVGETDKYFTKGKTYTLEISKFMDFSTIDDRTEKDEPQPHFMDVKFAFENFIHPNHYKPEPEQKTKCIYQVGDTVYHYAHGCGEVYSISPSKEEPYPISVQFDEEMVGFRLDGKLSVIDKKPSLSFVPYDLENGGFSQERPKPKPKIGDVGYFWEENDNFCLVSKICSIDTGNDCKYRTDGGNIFTNFSHEIPPHIKEKMK